MISITYYTTTGGSFVVKWQPAEERRHIQMGHGTPERKVAVPYLILRPDKWELFICSFEIFHFCRLVFYSARLYPLPLFLAFSPKHNLWLLQYIKAFFLFSWRIFTFYKSYICRASAPKYNTHRKLPQGLQFWRSNSCGSLLAYHNI